MRITINLDGKDYPVDVDREPTDADIDEIAKSLRAESLKPKTAPASKAWGGPARDRVPVTRANPAPAKSLLDAPDLSLPKPKVPSRGDTLGTVRQQMGLPAQTAEDKIIQAYPKMTPAQRSRVNQAYNLRRAAQDAEALQAGNPNVDPSMAFATNYGKTKAPNSPKAVDVIPLGGGKARLGTAEKGSEKAYGSAFKLAGTPAASVDGIVNILGPLMGLDPKDPAYRSKIAEAIGRNTVGLVVGNNPMDSAINLTLEALGPIAHAAGAEVVSKIRERNVPRPPANVFELPADFLKANPRVSELLGQLEEQGLVKRNGNRYQATPKVAEPVISQETSNARQIQEAAAVHGDLQPRPVQGEGQMPAAEGVERVQQVAAKPQEVQGQVKPFGSNIETSVPNIETGNYRTDRYGMEARKTHAWNFEETPGDYKEGRYTRGSQKGVVIDPSKSDNSYVVDELRYLGPIQDGAVHVVHSTDNPDLVVNLLRRNQLMGDRGDDLGFGLYAGDPGRWGDRGATKVPLVVSGKMINLDNFAFGDRLGKSEIDDLVKRGVYSGYTTARTTSPQLVIWDNRAVKNLDDLAAKYLKGKPNEETIIPQPANEVLREEQLRQGEVQGGQPQGQGYGQEANARVPEVQGQGQAEEVGPLATGLANQVIDREAVAEGLPLVQKGTYRNPRERYEANALAVQRGEVDTNSLLRELETGNRPPSADEFDYFTAEAARIQNRIESLKAQRATATPAQRAFLDSQIADATQAKMDWRQRVQALKTRTGESFYSLQAGADVTDFTNYREVLQSARDVKGAPLSPAREEMYQRLTSQLEEANAKLSAAEAKLAEVDAKNFIERQRRSQGRSLRLGDTRARREAAASEITRILQEATAQANLGLDPTILIRLAKPVRDYATALLEEGGLTLAELVDKIRTGIPGMENLDDKTIHSMLSGEIDRGTGKKITLSEGRQRLVALQKELNATSIRDRMEYRAYQQAERAQKQEQALLEQINQLENDLAAGNVGPTPDNSIRPPAELDPLRQRLADLKKQQAAMRNEARKDVIKRWRERTAGPAKEAKRIEDLTETIADLERRLEEGDYVFDKKTRSAPSAEVEKLRARRDALRKAIETAIRNERPTSLPEAVRQLGTTAQLLNPVSRILDVAANTTKLASYVMTDPIRAGVVAPLTERFIYKTGLKGADQSLFTGGKLKRVLDGTGARLAEEFRSQWMHGDLDTAAKVDIRSSNLAGNFNGGFLERAAKFADDVVAKTHALTGMTDIPFKDFYTRVALDDGATELAGKELGSSATRAQVALRRDEILSNLEDYPHLVAQANEWALRQTFNVDNRLSTGLQGAVQGVRRKYGDKSADTVKLLVDLAGGRFSRVIGNVAVDRVMSTGGGLPIGVVQGVRNARTARAAGELLTTTERKTLNSMIASGLTGTAAIFIGQKLAEKGILQGDLNKKGGYVDWGDLDQLGGYMTPVLLGATHYQIQNSGATPAQKQAMMWKSVVGLFADIPLTSGAERTMDIIKGQGAEKKIGQLASTQLVPGIIREWARRQDMLGQTGTLLDTGAAKERDAKTFGEQFQRFVPVTPLPIPNRQSLPIKKD